MSALLQENAEVISFSSDKIKGISGSYGYKKWVEEGSGQRKAFPVSGPEARFSADLIANSYRNRGGLAVVFGIVFDLDAHRAQEQWKDSEGRLDWGLIFSSLKKEIPEFAKYLCHAVRSTGGKGLALVMAITPMPIQDSTRPNQKAAENLQSRLINLFNRLGMGADEGARGLLRDFPNFNHPEKSIYKNTKILRELERSGRPVIGELHRVLNQKDQKEKAKQRIYNDERVESGLVNLVLWLMGAKDFSRKWVFEGEVIERKYMQVPFLSGWEVEASVKELCLLTGVSEGFMRGFLKNPPTWLKATYNNDRCWTLSLSQFKDAAWLLERCRHLGQKTQELYGKVSFDPNELCLPEYVEDGERNAWLVRLTLIYKWAGYSMDTTLEKVKLRLKCIPGFETSRNCRQISNIVRSLFRRSPEMHGVLSWKELPRWIRDDEFFRSKDNHIETRRGIAPVGSIGALGVMVGSGLDFEAPERDSEAKSLFLTESRKPEKIQELPEIKLWVVRRNQRIGIIRNNKLLLCFTKKHYRASALTKYLLELNPHLKDYRLRLISPRKKIQALFYEQMDQAEEVFSGASICGRKMTYAESMEFWREKKGIQREASPVVPVELEVPF